jgi:hypothetical protein
MRFILTFAAMVVLANVFGRLLAEPDKPRSQPTSNVSLYNGLGKHTRVVATSKPEAQKFFPPGAELSCTRSITMRRIAPFSGPRNSIPSARWPTGEFLSAWARTITTRFSRRKKRRLPGRR